MATIAKGNTAEIYVANDSSMVFTPGSGGSIEFDCSTPPGATRPDARTVYAAETISIPAGSTVFARAVGADATHTGASGGVSAAAAARVESSASGAGSLPAQLLAAPGAETLDTFSRSSPTTATGTYTGNGSSVAVTLGWRPDFVVIKANNTEPARFWSSASWYDRSDSLIDGESTGGGVTPTETGFTVGSAAPVNTNLATHHYFAYKDNGSGCFMQSNHMGNGASGRVLSTYAGIPIKFLAVKRDAAQSMVFAHKDFATSSDHNGVVAADAVISTDGTVTLSNSAKVNQWSTNLGEGTTTLAVPDGAADVHAVTYTGTGVARRISLPWQPDWVFITPRGATGGTGQMYFSSLAAGEHLPTGAGGVSTGRITSVDGSGVVISTAAQVNSSGIGFVMLAFRRSRRPVATRLLSQLRHTKAVQLTAGGYIDCGTSDSLKFSGACTLEWLGAIYPASTTPFAGGAGVNNESNKQFPLIFRSSGADGTDAAVSFGLSALCPRPEGTGQLGGDWSGASIAWATFDKWDLPQTSTPALDNFPAFSGVVMPFGEMTHIVLTHDGSGGWVLYVNGRPIKERKRDLVAAITRANITGYTGHKTVIGGRLRASTIDYGHSQQVRLVRVYRRALTPTEAIDNFRAAFGLATAATDYVEQWDANNASGSSLPASVNSENNGTITNGIVVG